jgi:hypothetical protein
MKKHWDQIGQHVICPIKHKCKFKNQNMQQAQHSDLIGLQIPFQSHHFISICFHIFKIIKKT